MPLELCTPTTINLVVMLFINSMENINVWGASLPFLKKKIRILVQNRYLELFLLGLETS